MQSTSQAAKHTGTVYASLNSSCQGRQTAKQHKTGLANLLVPLVKTRSFRTWYWDTLTIANANDALKCMKYKIKQWCYI